MRSAGTDPAATQLSALVNQFDALVLGAPVYTWRPASLTSIFQDKLRLHGGSLVTGTRPGRPALGIAVAGGTGTGIFGAIQSMYRWLAVWAFRPLPPILVTRFNLPAALAEAHRAGEQLAEATGSVRPFADLAECLLHYDSLPHLREGYADEFLWLARQIDAGLPGDLKDPRAVALREGLRAAEAALARGDRRRRLQVGRASVSCWARGLARAREVGSGLPGLEAVRVEVEVDHLHAARLKRLSEHVLPVRLAVEEEAAPAARAERLAADRAALASPGRTGRRSSRS